MAYWLDMKSLNELKDLYDMAKQNNDSRTKHEVRQYVDDEYVLPLAHKAIKLQSKINRIGEPTSRIWEKEVNKLKKELSALDGSIQSIEKLFDLI